jgi:hypothetical protein
MNTLSTSQDIYKFACHEFSFLNALGYEMIVDVDTTAFVSNTFKYVLYRDRYGEPPTEKLYSTESGRELISPYAALQYYMDDYLAVWNGLSDGFGEMPVTLKLIKTEVALLASNSWIFTRTDWVDDIGLVAAVSKTNKWLSQKLSEGVFPSHAEMVHHIRALRVSGDL